MKVSKYKKVLVESVANGEYFCFMCKRVIAAGEHHYKERLEDRFLQSLNLKRFCKRCFDEYGKVILSRYS